MINRYLHVLGLSEGASPAEIRAAFHRMALRYHPDRNPGDARAAARFQEALLAYQALRAGERSPADGPSSVPARPESAHPASPAEVALGVSLILGIGVLGVRLLALLYRKRRSH